MESKNKKILAALILAAILIAVIPVIALKDAEFGGSDDAGSVMVEEIPRGIYALVFSHPGDILRRRTAWRTGKLDLLRPDGHRGRHHRLFYGTAL